jgi:hypothetical protein
LLALFHAVARSGLLPITATSLLGGAFGTISAILRESGLGQGSNNHRCGNGGPPAVLHEGPDRHVRLLLRLAALWQRPDELPNKRVALSVH